MVPYLSGEETGKRKRSSCFHISEKSKELTTFNMMKKVMKQKIVGFPFFLFAWEGHGSTGLSLVQAAQMKQFGETNFHRLD